MSRFHYNKRYANAQHYYVTHTLPILSHAVTWWYMKPTTGLVKAYIYITRNFRDFYRLPGVYSEMIVASDIRMSTIHGNASVAFP